ncbi:MAG: ornithine cyclodeaminase family protein [Myxococcaceae bacterium]|nr:ornithine cyclodeaminase family protein [Myxococcaceae bacterium]
MWPKTGRGDVRAPGRRGEDGLVAGGPILRTTASDTFAARAPMDTLLLRHADVSSHLQALFLLEDLRAGFLAKAEGRTGEGRAEALQGAHVSLPGVLPAVPAYTLRVEPALDATEGRPSLLLHAAPTGRLLAIMDAVYLTRLTRAVVGALAADVLARQDASRVALLGAGDGAVAQLKALRLVRSLSHLRIWDTDPFRSAGLAARLYRDMSLPAHGALTVSEAVEDADVVLCVAPFDEPVLTSTLVRPGTHVSVLGPALPGHGPVAGELLRAARFVCDDRRLALEQGAAAGAGVGADVIDAELGDVLAGRAPGRRSEEERTVFGGVGLPFQDLVGAWQLYQAVRSDEDVQRFAFSP